jgi:hypothetical protein
MLKYIYLLILLFVFSSMFFSCKDNTTNPTTNGQILYTADTIKLSTNGTGNLNLHNEGIYYSPYSNIRKIQIEYTGETNIDSSKGICLMFAKVADQSGGNVAFYEGYNGITSINRSYSYTVIIPAEINLWYAQFRVEINTGFSPVTKYIMVRNVRVTGLSY